jgi:DNA-binding CsgD family transcriptional regulator
MVIDALLILAELAERRSSQVSAARLVGATSAVRERLGYRAPLVVHLIDADGLAERLSNEHPEAFVEGSQLDLDRAVAYARRMRGERSRPDFGWASLTPTERQVAELASEGCTNAQIAQRLLMKPATVKTHLTHIFVKLGVTNRTELAHLSARSDPDETTNEETA